MCTCGNPEPHVIARRTTADGTLVEIHSDGYVTGRLGYYLPGVGRRRLPAARLWAFADEVCLFAAAELGALVAEHQAAAKATPADIHPNAIRNLPGILPLRVPSRAEQGAARAAWRRIS